MHALIRWSLLVFATFAATSAPAQFVAPMPTQMETPPSTSTVPKDTLPTHSGESWSNGILPQFSPPPPLPPAGFGKAHRQTPVGRFLTNLTKPLSLATGGLIHAHHTASPCPAELAWLTHPDNLAVSPAEAIAAKIKAIEARAGKRRIAVRYLGTVDCHYFPEAEIALVKALREDTNECVRHEAAIALGKGCCCTHLTVAALLLVATGKCTDGNPIETSPRVRAAALYALNVCVSRLSLIELYHGAPSISHPMATELTANANGASAPAIQLTSYYSRYVSDASHQSLMNGANRALAEAAGTYVAQTNANRAGLGLIQLWTTAHHSGPAREEISYEESALSAPPKPIARTSKPPKQKPKKHIKKPRKKIAKQTPVRAIVELQPAPKPTNKAKSKRPKNDLVEKILKMKAPAPKPATKIPLPIRQAEKKAQKKPEFRPVPWPAAKLPTGGKAGERQEILPVAWPTADPVKNRQNPGRQNAQRAAPARHNASTLNIPPLDFHRPSLSIPLQTRRQPAPRAQLLAPYPITP